MAMNTQENMTNDPLETAAYDQSFVTLNRGDVIKGKVVRIESDGVLVDIGGKTEGVIPKNELSHKPVADIHTIVKVGDEIDVFVLDEDAEGAPKLSKKRADLEKTWIKIKEAHKAGTNLEGTVIEQVKGGLVVDLGVRGFIPASHIGKRGVKLEDLIGESLPLRVLEIDSRKGRVVLSHRAAVEEETKKSKSAFWSDIYEGQPRTGTVARITHFGAFVDLGGIDGLVHLSELSWKKIKHPGDALSVGDRIDVVVLGFDKEKERVSLSYRRAQPDPWTLLPENLKEGAIVSGSISKIAKRYVFVEVAPGIEGLIPIFELSEKNVNAGDVVRVKILEIKPDLRRMLLSTKQSEEAAERENYRSYIQAQEEKPMTIKDLLGDKLVHRDAPG